EQYTIVAIVSATAAIPHNDHAPVGHELQRAPRRIHDVFGHLACHDDPFDAPALERANYSAELGDPHHLERLAERSQLVGSFIFDSHADHSKTLLLRRFGEEDR